MYVALLPAMISLSSSITLTYSLLRKLIIRDDAAAACTYVAEYIIRRILTFAPTATKPFVLGLPTGSSPIQIYAALVAAHKRGRISFKHVITFNMDEYAGLPASHPQSYHTFMHTQFFTHVDIPSSQIHILDGTAPDLAAECAAFEAAIVAAGGIELFLGGIGSDGHIAFNEPGSSLRSRTRVAALAPSTVGDNARFFDGDVGKVPRRALTVGVGTVMEAREVVIVATGVGKAVAVRECVEGGVSAMWPVSVLQLHERAVMVVDGAAAGQLRVKTVEYAKGVEDSEGKGEPGREGRHKL